MRAGAQSLKTIPQVTAALGRAACQVGRMLVLRTAADLAAHRQPAPALVAISKVGLSLQLFLSRKNEKIIFFFFKQQGQAFRQLHANLDVVLRPAPAQSVATPPSLAAAARAARPIRQDLYSCRLLLPPFLLHQPSQAELKRYGPDGASAADTVLLRVGPGGQHVLSIRCPEVQSKAEVVFTKDRRGQIKEWDAEPFLELTETLRAWLVSGVKSGTEVELPLPTEPRRMNDVARVLHFFLRGHHDLEHAIAPTPKAPPLLVTAVPRYEVATYAAQITLCLDRRNRLATNWAKNPSSILLQLTVAKEAGETVARIGLGPADFLCTGELRATFLTELAKGTPDKLRRSLGVKDQPEWSAFLNSAGERAVIMRVARDGRADVNLVVLPGTHGGRPRTLILRTEARVDVAAQPPTVQLSRVELSYDSQKHQRQRLDDKTAGYFLQLAAALKHWLSTLQSVSTSQGEAS